MKRFALIVAAGSMTAMTAPAHAAEFTNSNNTEAATAIQAASVFAALDQNAQHAKDPPRHARAYGRRDRDRYDDRRYYEDRYDRDDRIYDRRGRYIEPRRVNRGDRVWQGRDGRYYCERSNGTTGLIIGAAGGALLGRAIDTRGDRTVGTVLGGAIGALLGREVDRGEARCR